MKLNREIRQTRERNSPQLKFDSVNSLDRKLATALKAALKKNKANLGEKLSNEFHKTLERVVNEDLRRILETLFSKIVCQTNETTQPELTEALRLLRTLLERGFRETPSVAFLAWLDLFSRLNVDEVLSVAPNTICFGRWLKKAKVSAQEIQRQLLPMKIVEQSDFGSGLLSRIPRVSRLILLYEH